MTSEDYVVLRSTLVDAYSGLVAALDEGDKLNTLMAAHTLGILLREFVSVPVKVVSEG